ncbi:MAG: hypothetical protein WCG26_12455 [Chloroflexales bacterium]
MARTWTSRVVRSAHVNPGTLLAHPDNVVIHPPEQEEAMLTLLRTVGWAAPILVSERTGRIIDGHMRASLAVRKGIARVPVDYVELSEEEERKALLYLRRTTALARIDPVNLEVVLNSIETDDDALAAMAASFAQATEGLKYTPKARVLVAWVEITVGPLTFMVTWAEYVQWRGMLREQHFSRKPTILHEIQRQLGLVVKP